MGHLRCRFPVAGEAELLFLPVANVIALMFGEIDGCDLEGVEEKAGATEIDVVAGDCLCHVGYGVLYIDARVEGRQGVGAGAGFSGTDLLRCTAELVVVVAAVASTKRRASAAGAVGVFLVAAGSVGFVFMVGKHVFDLVMVVLHGSPGYLFAQSLRNRRDIETVPVFCFCFAS